MTDLLEHRGDILSEIDRYMADQIAEQIDREIMEHLRNAPPAPPKSRWRKFLDRIAYLWRRY